MSFPWKSGFVASVLVLGLGFAGSIDAEAASESCRWKVKFIKYQVTDDGGERVLETLVSVSVDGSTVNASNRLRKGETASVGETVNTVTVTKTTKVPIKMSARERSFFPSALVLLDETEDLSCDRGKKNGRNRTTDYELRSSGDGFAYRVYLAFERV